MRRLSIPQKPDRPDIDDLIFGDDHKTQMRKVTALFDRFHAGLADETAAAWFFLYLFLKGNI